MKLFISLLSHLCIGYIMTGSWKGGGNRYIQLVKVLYCQLLTNDNQLVHLSSGQDSISSLRDGIVPVLILSTLAC